jgi:hypothetical protein
MRLSLLVRLIIESSDQQMSQANDPLAEKKLHDSFRVGDNPRVGTGKERANSPRALLRQPYDLKNAVGVLLMGLNEDWTAAGIFCLADGNQFSGSGC